MMRCIEELKSFVWYVLLLICGQLKPHVSVFAHSLCSRRQGERRDRRDVDRWNTVDAGIFMHNEAQAFRE